MKASKAIWSAFATPTDFPCLSGSKRTETLIIGGGVTGISLGMQLALAGRKAIVLEERRVGGGTSGQSTGNLYTTVDGLLSGLEGKYSAEQLAALVEARQAALNQIKQFIKAYSLDCDATEVLWHLYTQDPEDRSVQQELTLMQKLKMAIRQVPATAIPYPNHQAIAMPEQLQINPFKYVQSLAARIPRHYTEIYEHSPALSIESSEDGYRVHTPEGTVQARNLVHATHTPKGVLFLQTLLAPYREYGIAFRANNPGFEKGIYWGYHGKERFSTRIYSAAGQDYIVLVGCPHKVGQQPEEPQGFERLEELARENFLVDQIPFRWGGQHYRSADGLPYIGLLKDREYVATGYSTDGLVYGTLAGMMIKDEILGVENAWRQLLDPRRSNPLKSAKSFIKENLNVAAKYWEALAGAFSHADVQSVAAGEGKVIETGGHKLAVYREMDGSLKIHSAVCTHLGCIVHFNAAESSWDCPCHGSRFTTSGTVIEGPALENLPQINPEKTEERD